MRSSLFLGFDFGLKRIGVAVGESVIKRASMLETLSAKNGVPQWENIRQLIDEWQASALVVGVPLNMDNTTQPITHEAKLFADELRKRFNLPVHEVDERLSTVEARQQLFEAGGYKKLKQTPIDSFAAKIILEQWMTTNLEE